MILFRNSTSFSRGSQFLLLGVLLQAGTLCPVQAQDFDKVETKLKKSVVKGQLTEDQAKAMMDTLRKFADVDSDTVQRSESTELRTANLAQLGAQIRKLVATGKLTEEDGRAQMDRAREILAGEKPPAPDAAAVELGLKLRQAVRNGRITAEEGRARMAALLKHQQVDSGAGTDSEREHMEAMFKRIQSAVESGELTVQEVGDDMAKLKQQIMRSQFEKSKAELEQAVRNGRIPASEMERRLEQMKNRLAAATSEGQVDESRLERVTRRLQMAIKNGDLTEIEAREKLRAIKKEFMEPDEHAADQHGDHHPPRDHDDGQER